MAPPVVVRAGETANAFEPPVGMPLHPCISEMASANVRSWLKIDSKSFGFCWLKPIRFGTLGFGGGTPGLIAGFGVLEGFEVVVVCLGTGDVFFRAGATVVFIRAGAGPATGVSTGAGTTAEGTMEGRSKGGRGLER